MSDILLTAYDGAILGPIAKFLGWIMNGIYLGMYNLFGIESVTLSIVLITIIIYMCLLPLTIKQQKFSKLQQKMQPEIQKIQEKYKNKKDQESIQAMNQETQMVYEKYGVSPTGSCVQLLIQMPILFALYRVFYNIPAYIGSIKNNFIELANGIIGTEGYADTLAGLMESYKYTTSSNLTSANVAERLNASSGEALTDYVVDVLYKLPSTGWEKQSYNNTLQTLPVLEDYFPNLSSSIESTFAHMQKFNYFLGLNISDTPWNIIKTNFGYIRNINFEGRYLGLIIIALMIPLLSYLTQVISLKLAPQQESSNKNDANDQLARQMKTMNVMMPLMSFFLCFTVPVGLGFYWICTAVVRIVQQFFINKHISNLDLDDIIKKNQEKAKKKREKLGIAQNQIYNAAQIKTRTIESKSRINETSADKQEALERAAEIKLNARPGSLAAKANMVKEFNERNTRK